MPFAVRKRSSGSVEVFDLFAYTVEEIRRGIPLVQTALRTGKVLWEREPGFVATLQHHAQWKNP